MIVSVEGNRGSGKSTLLFGLSRLFLRDNYLDIRVRHEPQEWSKENDMYVSSLTLVTKGDVLRKIAAERLNVLDVLGLEPDIVVYLWMSPEECEQRVLERGCEIDNGIDIAYLNDLHKKHLLRLNELNRRGFQTFVVDGNKSQIDLLKEVAGIIRGVRSVFKWNNSTS
jgi:thymidylate kinase